MTTSKTGLECDLTHSERIAIAESSVRQLEQSLNAKRWQISSLEQALRIIRDKCLDSGDIAIARFADETLKTLDCTPEQIDALNRDSARNASNHRPSETK